LKDPKLTILDLLKNSWSLSYEPRFTADWYDGEVDLPQVSVGHIVTTHRYISLSEDLPRADRRIQGIYSVDVWSRGDSEKRWEMLEEVDRILKSRVNSPGDTLELAEVSSWMDLDEGDLSPPLFRSRLRVEVLYYG
jgi:hypothetical protein